MSHFQYATVFASYQSAIKLHSIHLVFKVKEFYGTKKTVSHRPKLFMGEYEINDIFVLLISISTALRDTL